jgi:NAD-dependent dihydropyrimidine dehydrogenase PreA subunit
MKRKIIKIDEEKCDGCGLCIPDCPEGALRIIDEKARLISDLFCDGLGACIGSCPRGAIKMEEREAEPYNEKKVMENIIKQGPNVIKAHLTHLKEHNEIELLDQAIAFLEEKGINEPIVSMFRKKENPGGHERHAGGCPGARTMDLRAMRDEPDHASLKLQSTLRNWPVQLQLLNPHAPYLKNADLLVSADCVPFAFANFHQRFLKGKVMVNLCPKLDQTIEAYIDILAVIFKDNDIKSISVVQMEVPCCGGTLRIVQEALKKAEKVIPVEKVTISISGEII